MDLLTRQELQDSEIIQDTVPLELNVDGEGNELSSNINNETIAKMFRYVLGISRLLGEKDRRKGSARWNGPDKALTGTITNVVEIVTGVGTTFTTQLDEGDFIAGSVDGEFREVLSIEDNTHLTLVKPFSVEIDSAQAFKRIQYMAEYLLTLGGGGGGGGSSLGPPNKRMKGVVPKAQSMHGYVYDISGGFVYGYDGVLYEVPLWEDLNFSDNWLEDYDPEDLIGLLADGTTPDTDKFYYMFLIGRNLGDEDQELRWIASESPTMTDGEDTPSGWTLLFALEEFIFVTSSADTYLETMEYFEDGYQRWVARPSGDADNEYNDTTPSAVAVGFVVKVPGGPSWHAKVRYFMGSTPDAEAMRLMPKEEDIWPGLSITEQRNFATAHTNSAGVGIAIIGETDVLILPHDELSEALWIYTSGAVPMRVVTMGFKLASPGVY